VAIGATCGVRSRGDRLGSCVAGGIMAGVLPGVLLRVCHWWTRGVVAITLGGVGLVEVVTGVTLCFGSGRAWSAITL
jgi:hypothetical protein